MGHKLNCCFSLDNASFLNIAPLLQVLQISEFTPLAKGAQGFNIDEQMSKKEWAPKGVAWLQ